MTAAISALRHRGILSVGGATVLTTTITFGFTTASARLLSTSDYAGLVFFLTTAALLSSLFDLGLSVRTTTAFDHDADAWHDPPLRAYWSGQLLSYGIGATLGTAVVAATFTTHLGSAFILTAVAAWSTGIVTFVSATYLTRQMWDQRARLNVGFAVSRTALGFVAVLLFHRADVTVGAFTVGGLVAMLVFIRFWLREPKVSPDSLNVDTHGAWRVWIAGRWYALAGAIGSVAIFAPVAVVNLRGTVDDQAVVGLALMVGGMAAVLLNVSMTTLLPRACNTTIPLRSYLRDYAITVIPLAGVLVVGALATPILLPRLFGRQFEPAVVPVELLFGAYLVLLFANPLQFLHYRQDRQRFLTTIDALQLATLIVLAVVLSAHFSIPVAATGAVFASSIVSRCIGVGRIAVEVLRR